MPDPEGLTAAVQCDKTGLDHSDDPSPNPGVCSGVKNDQKAQVKQFLSQDKKNEYGKSLMCLSVTQPWFAQPARQQNDLHRNV